MLLFHCRDISDHKYCWSGKTLSVPSKSILRPENFLIKFLIKFVWKLEKSKSQRTGNRKHSFSVTWIFCQLTDLCPNYAIQLNQMSDICEIGKLAIKMWFSFNFAKNLKDRHFVVGGSKNLKLSPKTCFGVSFQTMYFRFFCYFRLSVIKMTYDSERNEIAQRPVISTISDYYKSNFQKQ